MATSSVSSTPAAGAAESGLRPTPIPTLPAHTRPTRWDGDGNESSDDGEAMDPNVFDLMLSRSLQSGGPSLEAESVEYSMLRNTHIHHDSCGRSQHSRRRPSVATVDGAGDSLPHENTPLLESTSSSSSSATYSHETDPKSTSTSPYLGGVSPARFWIIFMGIMSTYFVACFDSTIMASSHPVITSYFGASNQASWLSTAFLLTSTSFQPLLGGLSDAIGRKIPYVVTMAIFLVSTLWCALAQSMTSFIIARAVCGLGAGGMITLGSIMVSDLVPIEIRGAFQSYINMTYGVGAMLGAGLGGMMADYLGWRWEFGVQVPLLALALVLSIATIPSDLGLHGKQKQDFWEAMRKFDFKGSFLMSTSISFLILGLSLGGNIIPWSHPIVIASLVAFATSFPLFLFVETRATKPIMPMHLVQKSPHMNLIFSNFFGAIVANAIIFNVPLFFQGVLLTSATTSGLRLVISSAVSSSAGTATGFLITYTRRLRWPLILGSCLTFVGTLCLSSMQRSWPALVYLLCLVPSAMGQGFQFPGTFMAILAVADQSAQAVVTSTLILWRSLGMVLGVALSSLVLQNALWFYLDLYVTGPDKEAIVELVRQSVESIRELDVAYQVQVVQSYEAALRLTFIGCTVLALVNVLLVLPVKLPRLGNKN